MGPRIRQIVRAAATACLASLACAQTNAPPALDAGTAVALALAHNRDLQLEARRVAAARLAVEGASAEFTTGIRSDSGASISSDSDAWQYGAVLTRPLLNGTDLSAGANYRSETFDDGTESRGWAARLGLSQPLFRNYGTLVNSERLTRARREVLTAMRAYEARRDRLALDVLETYEAVLRIERQLDADAAFLSRADRFLRLTRAREAQGRATRVEALRVELQVGEARARRRAGFQRLETARRVLADLLGGAPDAVFTLAEPPETVPENVDAAAATGIALSNRMDYAQVVHNVEDARRGLKIAERSRWPDVRLLAQYDAPFATDAGAKREESWFVGLTTGNGFNPRQSKVEIATAGLGVEDARDRTGIAALQIGREVRDRIEALSAARDEQPIQQRNVELARARAELARRQFEAGRGDHFSATDAEDALNDAIGRLLDSRSATRLAAYRLRSSLGTLIEHPAELRAPPGHLPEAPL